MRTLVTGGAGFIGTHLVSRLLAEGGDVVVLDNMEPQVHGGSAWPHAADVELIEGDVGDPHAADHALRGVDRIVHLAAVVGVGQSMYEIERYVRQNSAATASFLERVLAQNERPQRFVVASSMSIYGEGEYACAAHDDVAPGPRPDEQLARREWECRCPACGQVLVPIPTKETKPLIPTSVYAIAKRDHEELSLVVGRAYGISTTALRFFNVYGPGQALSNPYTGVAAIFASRLLNRRAPIVFEDGQQSRDFVHVSDIVKGVILALESDASEGRAVNLGTGRQSTVLDVAAALAAGLDIRIEPELTGDFRAGDIRHCFADVGLAQELLGFEADIELKDGMADLAGWLAGQDAVDRVEDATRELRKRGLAR